MKKNYTKAYTALALLGTVTMVGATSVSAAEIGGSTTSGTQTKSSIHRQGNFNGVKSNGVMGTITSINGTIITITTKAGTIYTVDATNGIVKNNGVNSTLSTLVVGSTLFVHGTVTGTNVVATSIDTGTMITPQNGSKIANGTFKGKGVTGTVTLISGTSITVKNKAGVIYTVDATKAIVDKNGVTSTVSSITIGDMIMAQGTVTGTNVVATIVHDGKVQGKGETPGAMAYKPMVSGTVTSVSGTMLTVKGKDSVLYTVDGTNAKVMKSVIGSKPTIGAVASIIVGDTVRVQGTLTGTNMVATNILDGVLPQKSATKTPHIRTSSKTTSTH